MRICAIARRDTKRSFDRALPRRSAKIDSQQLYDCMSATKMTTATTIANRHRHNNHCRDEFNWILPIHCKPNKNHMYTRPICMYLSTFIRLIEGKRQYRSDRVCVCVHVGLTATMLVLCVCVCAQKNTNTDNCENHDRKQEWKRCKVAGSKRKK